MSVWLNLSLSISEKSTLHSSNLSSGVVLRVKIRWYVGKCFILLKLQKLVIAGFVKNFKPLLSFYVSSLISSYILN